MPVFFVGVDADGVAGGNGPDGLAPLLEEATAFFHEQQLRRAMSMPVGAPAWLELDQLEITAAGDLGPALADIAAS